MSDPHDPKSDRPMPGQYRPSDHEPEIARRWEGAGAFVADPSRVLEGDAEPYCVLLPPPNVTAALHLGHALNATVQDVLVRSHRMRGFETLWMPGTDHAGIATQSVVERRLLETEGRKRTDFSRDEFVARVGAFKDEYEARITEQFRRLGCSCDFSRQRFTMDPVCARAVREAFFELFKQGLIYRGKRLVNWDPVLQTAIADDEVESVEIEGVFAYLRYPLVHPATNPDDPMDAQEVTWSELAARGYPGAERMPGDDNAWITVATTRPETYLGDTAVAVNPRDPRRVPLAGLLVQLPLVGRIIPIVEDEYVVMPDAESSDPKARLATGFLKVTPAHDPNDWEIGVRRGLEPINVMAPDASISDEHGWSRGAHNEGGHVFLGKSREQARKLVLREFEARNLLEKVVPHRHAVGHSDRSGVPIEPYLSDQWYVRVTDDRLRGVAQRALAIDQRSAPSLDAWPDSTPLSHAPASRDGAGAVAAHPASVGAGDGSLRFCPDRYAKTYESWHDNLRDWCISRQLWWGHRVPVWGLESNNPDHDPEVEAALRHEDWAESDFGKWEQAGRIAVYRRGPEGGVHSGQPFSGIEFPSSTFICVRSEEDREVIEFLERNGTFVQDPDVLDTWFSSALWPLSTMGWPDPDRAAAETGIADFPDLLPAFNPTSVLCTAREIITLWVSRMVMFNRFFRGDAQEAGNGQEAMGTGEQEGDGRAHEPVPFRDVFIHAMIQDGDGRKMSKSLGNGVDPLDIIESHGSDALRFTLCHMTTQTQDVRMPVERDERTGKNTSPKFDLGRNFCNKLWNAARFSLGILDGAQPVAFEPDRIGLADRWMLSRLRGAIVGANSALERYEFSQYATILYDLLWRDFCDWYLEAVKPTARSNPSQQAVLRCVLDAIVRVIHPVCPFITESIHDRLRDVRTADVSGLDLGEADPGAMLCRTPWPGVAGSLEDPQAERAFDRVQRLVSSIREVRAQHRVNPKHRITVHMPIGLERELEEVDGLELVQVLAGLDAIKTTDTSGDDAEMVEFTFDAMTLAASDLADRVDHDAERARLEKLVADLRGAIDALERRLANPGYTEKAPAHLVEQTRTELDTKRRELDTALDTLERTR